MSAGQRQPSPGEFSFVPPPEDPETIDPSDLSRHTSGESWEPYTPTSTARDTAADEPHT